MSKYKVNLKYPSIVLKEYIETLERILKAPERYIPQAVSDAKHDIKKLLEGGIITRNCSEHKWINGEKIGNLCTKCGKRE